MVFDLVVHDAQRLGGLGGDDDAAGVAVDAVAQGGDKGGLVPRVPLAGLGQIGLDVGDERVRAAALVGVDDHAGLLVRQKDIVILVQNLHARDRNFLKGHLLGRPFKKLVVDV